MTKYHKIYLWAVVALGVLVIVLVFIIHERKPSITPIPASPSPTPTAAYTDFHLLIPSLDINTPVIADVDGNNKNVYSQALEQGVAQLKGSAKPGEGSNTFIFGHSSNYWWAKGNYKTIFAPLPKINKNDEIILWYNSKEYKYVVTDLKTVPPSAVDVVNQTPFEQLSLMTCVPVGTDKMRLIVTAKPE